MCGGVIPAPGSGSLLPPGAGDASQCPPDVWSKYLLTDPLGGSGDFPFPRVSPMPPGISVSIGVDILWTVKDWNCPSGVYKWEGVGFGDRTERGLIGDECGDSTERSPSTSLASL